MIIFYRGSRGRGKTLTMVKDAFQYYLDGYRILSNINLSFGEYISEDDVLALNRESGLMNCVLVLDEIQLFFDSRNFSKASNKEFSNFIQQIRKRNIIILFTAQYVNTVDLRIRQCIDVVVYPNYSKELVKVEYYDITRLEDGIDISLVTPSMIYYEPSQIYGLYDTMEMLK